MNISTPKHLGNIIQALDALIRQYEKDIAGISPCDPDYADCQEAILSISDTLAEVGEEYESLREKSNNLIPLADLLGDTFRQELTKHPLGSSCFRSY